MDTYTLAQRTIVFIHLCTFMAVTSSFDMTILHTNDVHVRVEQITTYGTDCDADNAQDGKCFGGVRHRLTQINEIKNNQDKKSVEPNDAPHRQVIIHIIDRQTDR